MNVIGYDTLGSTKAAYVINGNTMPNAPAGIEISGINLQKLFIQLTKRRLNNEVKCS